MQDTLFMQDKKARERIESDIFTNFFVEAGAGSGKTYSLVQRMVSMVEAGIDVSKICAITFTKAAAGEFYSRFQEALAKKASENANCAEALKNIDLCFMGTIDSFCNMILSEHPAEAGIPSNSMVIPDEEMDALCRREYSLIQNGVAPYGEALKEKCTEFRAMYWNAEEVFLSLLKIMLANRNAKIMQDDAQPQSPEEVFQDVEGPMKELIKKLFAHPEYIYEKNKNSVKAYEELKARRQALLGEWSEDVSDLLAAFKSLKDLRLIPTIDPDQLGMAASALFTAHESRGKTGWYEVDEESEYYIKEKIENLQAAVALSFVADCVEPVARKLKQEGSLTFFDYLLYLRDMLKEDTAKGGVLIRHIYARHSYFLIDEFQDTNPLQAEIFFYLAAQNPTPDWRACIPKPGSLFIVGDPKQSIYRFRSADVASFSKVKALFTGSVGEVLYLNRNFRSTYQMNEWFNQVFTGLLPEDTENQSRFREIPLGDKPDEDGTFEGVYYYPSYSGKTAEESDKDPFKVADIIEQLVDNPAYLIREKENKEDAKIRRITYKDFMIITPVKTKLADYMQEFTARNIPFLVEGKVVFHDCPALVHAAKIFAALAHPSEKIYQVGVEKLDLLEEKGFPVNDLSCAALLGLILEHYPVFAAFGSENLETALFAMELLHNAEISGEVASLKDGSDYLSRLISDESDEERTISPQWDENKVHLANLHKVKGLEAPIVILASPSQKKGNASMRVDHSDEMPKCWIFAAEKNFFPVFQNHAFEAEKELEEEALAAERLRLLYVAATRARRVLLVGRALNASGNDLESNPWLPFIDHCDGDFFNLQKGEVQPTQERMVKPVSSIYQEAADHTIFADSSSGEKTYEIRRPSMIKVKGRSEENDFEDAEDEQARTRVVRKDPALVGTMVHKLMETMVSAGDQIDLKDTVQEILSEYAYTEADGEEMLTNVGETMRNGGYPQVNDAPQDLLEELLSADEVFCEVPFCYQLAEEEKGSIWNGVMDAIYKKNGNWHIIDYKTNADPSDLDKKYQEQLGAYIKAFKELTGEEADALIYHIDV